MNTRLALALASLLAPGVASSAQAQQVATRGATPTRPAAISAADLDVLKAQLEALQSRIAELEAAQQAQVAAAASAAESARATASEQQDAIDRNTDSLAQNRANVGEWVGRWQWKGDLRYRNENIDQEFTLRERNRDRIRARVGFIARVNDTVRVELQATTTENGDARSSNQTLTDASSRKALDLDTAYAEWAPNASWKLTAGKMRYPWVRTGSYFYDGDVNPEGVAVNYQQGATGVFASAWVSRLSERGALADSNLFGAQLGWRGTFGDGGRVMLAAGYFDHGAVEGYSVIQTGTAGGFFGNSTTTSTAICRSGQSPCLANDYDVVELLGEVQFKLGSQPLTLFVDYANNGAADYRFVSTNPTANIPPGLDTAYSAGFTYGRASNPRSWELGYVFQKVEKDALFAQWIDSDFAAGATDGNGHAVKLAYAFARNWRFNLTYMLNQTSNDVATAVTIPSARNVFDRDYKRLQLDLNMTF
ncbi:MAG: putative porin [Gammaproteobacteria bacterium]|nr:putative porin [Gammaproteobacteria bacterium]